MTRAYTTATAFDAADYLDSPEAVTAYLNAAFEDGSPDVITAAIGAIVRSRGATKIAQEADVSREAVYKAFVKGGNPTLSTMLSVLKTLGMELRVEAN